MTAVEWTLINYLDVSDGGLLVLVRLQLLFHGGVTLVIAARDQGPDELLVDVDAALDRLLLQKQKK